MVEDWAFSHKTDYVTFFLKILNPEGLKSYGDFAELVYVARWWSCIGKVCAQPAKQACFDVRLRNSFLSLRSTMSFFHTNW